MGIEKYSEFQNKLKDMKSQMLKDVISDESLSKLEKLKLISDNELMGFDSAWCDPFYEKYHKTYITIVSETPEFKAKWGKYPTMKLENAVSTDDFFVNNHYERHQLINLSDIAEMIDVEWDDSQKVLIYTNRTTKDTFQITKEEFIDTIYEWVIKNKFIGFELDW